MKVVSIINYKGGVGKTTITANLGTELACRGYRVLLIDADPQCSLTFSFLTFDKLSWLDEKELTLKTFFTPFVKGISNYKSLSDLRVDPSPINEKIQQYSEQGSLHLIPSDLALIDIDMKLAGRLAGGYGRLEQAEQYITIFSSISQGLETLTSSYDFVLIDCPPNFNIVTQTSIAASNYIVIPARPDHLSTLGISYLTQSIHDFKDDYNFYAKQANTSSIDPKILKILFTMVKVSKGKQPIKDHQRYIDDIEKTHKLNKFDAFIREYPSLFSRASADNIPVILNSSAPLHLIEEIKEFVDEFEYSLGEFR
jgi:chromosome partitioning protein